MRLPILELRRSDGPATLAGYKPTRLEAVIVQDMERAVAALSSRAPLDDCHRVVAAAGARHGLRKGPSVALWTRASLRVFEAGASDRPAADVGSRLEKLVDFAFTHAGQELQSTGLLVPFLITVGTGPPALRQFKANLPDVALADARSAAMHLPFEVRAYALAVERLPTPGAIARALYVETAERGSATGHLYARDMKRAAPSGRLEFTGPFERVGESDNLFQGTK